MEDIKFKNAITCINNNDLAELKLILDSGEIDINEFHDRDNLLTYSVSQQNYEAVKLLLQYPEIDVNVKKFFFQRTTSLILIPIILGNPLIFELLFNHKNINFKNIYGMVEDSILEACIRNANNQISILSIILNNTEKDDFDYYHYLKSIVLIFYYDFFPDLSIDENKKIMELLIDKLGENINEQIHFSLDGSEQSLVEKLISFKRNKKQLLLDFLSLLKDNVYFDINKNSNVLLNINDDQDIDLVKVLIDDLGADITKSDNPKSNLYFKLIRNTHENMELFKFYVSKGLDFKIDKGRFLLESVVYKFEYIEYLLESKKLNVNDMSFSLTLLQKFCMSSYLDSITDADIFKTLLRYGADPNKYKKGKINSPIALVVHKNKPKLLSLLLEHKANPNIKITPELSLLGYSFLEKKKECFDILISHPKIIVDFSPSDIYDKNIITYDLFYNSDIAYDDSEDLLLDDEDAIESSSRIADRERLEMVIKLKRVSNFNLKKVSKILDTIQD